MAPDSVVYLVNEGSRVRVGKSGIACSECGASGNHCYDYCPKHNTVYNVSEFWMSQIHESLGLEDDEPEFE